MRLTDLTDTIVALATPPGIGAIGVIRLSGPKAIELTDRIFKGKILARQASHTAHFGRIESPEGQAIDEVLATIFHENKSYTGQETVEISCHGSPFIQQRIIELCLQQGARMAEPGEYTLRAFLNGKLDLSQAEAVADLIASESSAAHAVALNQLRGGFKKEIQVLREELIHFASMVELELDFGEEDVEFADRDDLKKLVEKIRQHLRPLINSFALGNALKTGVTTVHRRATQCRQIHPAQRPAQRRTRHRVRYPRHHPRHHRRGAQHQRHTIPTDRHRRHPRSARRDRNPRRAAHDGKNRTGGYHRVRMGCGRRHDLAGCPR